MSRIRLTSQSKRTSLFGARWNSDDFVLKLIGSMNNICYNGMDEIIVNRSTVSRSGPRSDAPRSSGLRTSSNRSASGGCKVYVNRWSWRSNTPYLGSRRRRRCSGGGGSGVPDNGVAKPDFSQNKPCHNGEAAHKPAGAEHVDGKRGPQAGHDDTDERQRGKAQAAERTVRSRRAVHVGRRRRHVALQDTQVTRVYAHGNVVEAEPARGWRRLQQDMPYVTHRRTKICLR